MVGLPLAPVNSTDRSTGFRADIASGTALPGRSQCEGENHEEAPDEDHGSQR